jgi:hypothetical protein
LSGVGQGSVTVDIKKVSDDSTVTSTTSDNAGDLGYYSRDHDTVGYPGPVVEQYTFNSTTKKRDGRVHGQLAGLIWADDVGDVFSLFGIGVSTGLAVSANGSSMAPAVSAGLAVLKDGLPYLLESASSVTLDAADVTNPRIDRIVLRLTREGQSDQGKIALTKITGTPASSPSAPSLTQTSATWDLSLAQVQVGAGVTTIAADKVTDERTYCFTFPAGVSAGDLFYINAAGQLTRLAKGTNGQLLKIGATIPAWVTVTLADLGGGTIASQDSDDVSITGGSITSLDELSVSATDSDVFVIRKAGGGDRVVKISTVDTNEIVQFLNGTTLQLYSDDGSTLNAVFDGATGSINVQDIVANDIEAVGTIEAPNLIASTGLLAEGSSQLGAGNGSVTNIQGHLNFADTTKPTASIQAAAGSGASATIEDGSTDISGRITLNVGTSPTTGELVRITFASARANTTYKVFLEADDPSAMTATTIRETHPSTDYWTLTATGSAPGASADYIFNYLVID